MAGRKLIVEVAADISQYVKGLSQASTATKKLDISVSELNVDTKKLTETAVRASVRRAERLEKEVAGYRQLAAAAVKGSREQIAATNLAAQSERKLASSFAVAGAEAREASRHTNRLGRDVDHAARGALSGSGLFHSFGRSLAFASGGFIAFHEASDFIRESINAAREAVVAQRSLAAQMKTSGESFEANRERIEKVAVSYGKFGFQNDEVIQSLTVLERGTGNINKAISLQGLTADVARAKNLDLAKAATVVAKVFGGQETALRRAVPGLQKNAHGWELIRQAQAKLAGQAAANTTASEQFAATLHDTEEIVGTALLPTLNQYLRSLGDWLQKMNESGRLQKDVADVMSVLTEAVHLVRDAFKDLNKITGSTKHTLELLAGAFVAFKTLKIARTVLDVAGGIRLIGRNARRSAGEVGILQAALDALKIPALLGIAGGGAAAIAAPAIAGAIGLHFQTKETGTGNLLGHKVHFQGGGRFVVEKGKGASALQGRRGIAFDNGKWYDTETGKEISTREAARALSVSEEQLVRAMGGGSAGALKTLLQGVQKQTTKPSGVDLRTAGGIVVSQKPLTRAQRRTFFDASIQRALSAVTDTPSGAEASLTVQLQRLRVIAEKLKAKIALVKDITYRNKLLDQLQQVINEEYQTQKAIAEKTKQAALDAAQAQQDATDAMLAAAQLTIDKAGLTKSLNDDIAGWQAYLAKVRAREKVQGQTVALEEQAVTAQSNILALNEQLAQQREAARAARQFRVLGLGPEGEDLIPGVGNLRKRLQTLRANIADTSLDTRATQQMIRHIGTVLSGAFGAVGEQVRAKIDEIFKGWADALKTGRDDLATKFRPVDANKFIAGLGLGLTPDQVRRLRAGIVTLGPHATAPTQHTGAFALAGGVTINGGMHLHGVQDMGKLEAEFQKRAHGRPHPRRGAR